MDDSENPKLYILSAVGGWAWAFTYHGKQYRGGPFEDDQDANKEMIARLAELKAETP